MFKAKGIIIESKQEKEMAVKTVDRTFLKGQSVDLFRQVAKTISNNQL
jgi:hypothetical protein